MFVEFLHVQWEVVKPGREYRCKPVVNLHIVTDWKGDASSVSELQEEGLEVLDYSSVIHRALQAIESVASGISHSRTAAFRSKPSPF